MTDELRKLADGVNVIRENVRTETRDVDVSRMLNVFSPDVPTSSVGTHAYILRKAVREVLDMGYGDSLVFLSLVMTDEDTDAWALRVWTEASPERSVSVPCAVLVRMWAPDEDGTYAPNIRVIFRPDYGWDEMGGCIRVDVPETWWDWE